MDLSGLIVIAPARGSKLGCLDITGPDLDGAIGFFKLTL